MTQTIPQRLKKEPLIETVWEIRFSSDIGFVEELLPGLLFNEFKGDFLKIEKLPIANLPQQARLADPNLFYLPTVRLIGLPYVIQVGEHVVSLSCGRPYSSWSIFGEKILRLAEVLKNTNLISRPERFSLKYIDILPTDSAPTIDALNVVISIAGQDIGSDPIMFRTERKDGELLHVIQIIYPAQVQTLDGIQTNGILLDTDTIYDNSLPDFWQGLTDNLMLMHQANKTIFFNLLKEETISSLEPEY